MEFSRTDRVSGEIKKAVSEIINNELKDPRIQGLISVTKVEVSKDLRHAKIFLSIYGEESVKQNALEGIKNAEGFIRRELANRVRLKFIPELNFKLDESIEYGIHISKLLKDINYSGNED
ncbi:30S ribosome-binding factor RbfA [Thermosediminibacter litoriperuensis]|uniref:Ribosome-binding factor A n=1 Tax=Thermosediminibacter litoriperuensis TaxID=291989 RepID=A0A5S5AR07_9FIRM|nr:30S ribosome-binding factor RbfA [Thermosediminibacter litoriperuensis]TYP54295.1 ribosome-binding factor A [Thermosediminibacter litoriperuensis]